MKTSNAAERVKKYYAIWTSGDRAAMEAALTDDFHFSSPAGRPPRQKAVLRTVLARPANRVLKEDVTVDANEGDTILDVARSCGVPVGSNCGGVCRCSTCHVYVAEGFDSLEEMSDKEADRLDRAFDVKFVPQEH